MFENLSSHAHSQSQHSNIDTTSLISTSMTVDSTNNQISTREVKSIKEHEEELNDIIDMFDDDFYFENNEIEDEFENVMKDFSVFSLTDLSANFISKSFINASNLSSVSTSTSMIIKFFRSIVENLVKIDYKTLHRKEKNSKTNNINQNFKSHIHMRKTLNALKSEDNFDLDHVFESINYKEALKSFY